MTLLSRIFGLFRTALFAFLLGTTAIADSFFLAFQIPNFLRRLFAEGAMSSGIIPLLNSIDKDDKAKRQHFIHTMSMIFLIFVGGIVFLGIFFSSNILHFFYFFSDNLMEEQVSYSSLLLQIMFPYLLFISLTALCQGILNSYGNFSLPAMTPILFNIIVVVGGGLLLSKIIFPTYNLKEQIIVLACVITLAGLGQFLFLFFFVMRLGYSLWGKNLFSFSFFRDFFFNKWTKSFFKLMIPVFFTTSIYQINILLIQPLAIGLGEGRVAVLFYSNRIMELPLGIIAVSITTVSLPTLSKLIYEKKQGEFLINIKRSIHILFLLIFPILVIGLFYRELILSLLFKMNQFDEQSVKMTAVCLFFHLLAIPFISLQKIMNNIYLAFQNTRFIFIVSLIGITFNIGLAYVLTRFLNWDVEGIALASLFSFLLMFVILFLHLYYKMNINLLSFLIFKSLQFLGLLILPTFLLFVLHQFFFKDFDFFTDIKLNQFIVLAVQSLIFLVLYGVTFYLSKQLKKS